MSHLESEHIRRRQPSREESDDKKPTRSSRDEVKDRPRRRSDPVKDRYDSYGGSDYKRQRWSQHRLSDSRRSMEAPKAAYNPRTSPSRLHNGSEAQLNQAAWHGKDQAHNGLSHYSQHQTKNHHADYHADVRQRHRSTHRDRPPGRFMPPHSQQITLPMQQGSAPAAYQQVWPSCDQQRPRGPNPFRGSGKWKHDLFEELTKPAATSSTAQQESANNTAVQADSTADASK